MPAGDFRGTIVQLLPGSTFAIQPPAGEEIIIHNIYTSNTVDFQVVNSQRTITLEPNLVTCLTGYFFHASNVHYFQFINKTSETIYVGYDGIATK